MKESTSGYRHYFRQSRPCLLIIITSDFFHYCTSQPRWFWARSIRRCSRRWRCRALTSLRDGMKRENSVVPPSSGRPVHIITFNAVTRYIYEGKKERGSQAPSNNLSSPTPPCHCQLRPKLFETNDRVDSDVPGKVDVEADERIVQFRACSSGQPNVFIIPLCGRINLGKKPRLNQMRAKPREKHSVASPPRVFHLVLSHLVQPWFFASVDPATLGEYKLLDSYL